MKNRTNRKDMLDLVGWGRGEENSEPITEFAGLGKPVRELLFVPGSDSSLCRLPAAFRMRDALFHQGFHPSLGWFVSIFASLAATPAVPSKGLRLAAGRKLPEVGGRARHRQGQDPDLQQFLCLASEACGFPCSGIFSSRSRGQPVAVVGACINL